ncbi:hypothetical protein Cni_G07013 [Canna indica]|uniref:Uncharacterized protein n=1 Tax=Canna indica TaxID=4628 RepID=A0AAQ3Q5B2_9LILI|nr:hypothetical protein Cni_G07013 [Canna indica]
MPNITMRVQKPQKHHHRKEYAYIFTKPAKGRYAFTDPQRGNTFTDLQRGTDNYFKKSMPKVGAAYPKSKCETEFGSKTELVKGQTEPDLNDFGSGLWFLALHLCHPSPGLGRPCPQQQAAARPVHPHRPLGADLPCPRAHGCQAASRPTPLCQHPEPIIWVKGSGDKLAFASSIPRRGSWEKNPVGVVKSMALDFGEKMPMRDRSQSSRGSSSIVSSPSASRKVAQEGITTMSSVSRALLCKMVDAKEAGRLPKRKICFGKDIFHAGWFTFGGVKPEASQVISVPSRYGGGMSSTKTALESDTRVLAFEAGRKCQIRVNTISACMF